MWLGVCPTRLTDAPLPAKSWQPLLPSLPMGELVWPPGGPGEVKLG